MSAETDAKLANRILRGLVLGAIAGSVVLLLAPHVPGLLDAAKWVATNLFDPLGQVFLRMLFFVVIPLVFASLAGGVVQLGELSNLGPLAGRTFALFFANMTIAAALGLLMMNLLNPGGRMDDATTTRLVKEYSGEASQHVDEKRDETADHAFDRRRHVHAPQSVRRIRRQPAQRARRRAAADHVRDPARRRRPEAAGATSQAPAGGPRYRRRPDDGHRAFRVAAGALRGAGDDLQRRRQGRLRHPGRARPVRARLRRHAAAASFRHDVDLAEVSRQAQTGRVLP